MERAKPVVVGLFAAIALFGAGQWHARFATAPDSAVASAAVMASPTPTVERSLGEMRMGLTELRQAAKTGDPLALREAEKDVVGPLLDGLSASKQDGRLDRLAYARMVGGVAEVQGLFREIPYLLVVKPGDGLDEIRLPLRRSPIPAIESRGKGLGWAMTVEGDTVTLTP